MEYVNLGRSGLKVSRVSLGSWLTYGNALEQQASDAIVGRAVDLGINLFDTADVYNRGEGEKALAQAIRGHRRQHLVLASKCYFPMSDDVNDRGLSRKHIFESIDQSLRRLQTDYLDLYQCHRFDPSTPVIETVRAMDDLIRQGKILYWGVSEWPAASIQHAVDLARAGGMSPPISNQPKYNLFDRGIEHDVIPVSEAAGVGQIVFSPLAQGVLTGKYPPGSKPAPDTRAGNDKINGFIGRYMADAQLAQAERMAKIARAADLEPSQLALAWCLRKENVSSVIVGASRIEQLEENVAAGEVTLTTEQLVQLDVLFPAPPPGA